MMREVGKAAYWENAIYEINTEELVPVSLEAKYITKCKFYHYSKVFNVSDIVTLAGLARLLNEDVLPRFEEKGE